MHPKVNVERLIARYVLGRAVDDVDVFDQLVLDEFVFIRVEKELHVQQKQKKEYHHDDLERFVGRVPFFGGGGVFPANTEYNADDAVEANRGARPRGQLRQEVDQKRVQFTDDDVFQLEVDVELVVEDEVEAERVQESEIDNAQTGQVEKC